MSTQTNKTMNELEKLAQALDESDPLAKFRQEFLHPPRPGSDGPAARDCIYLTGNSLGLQPRNAARYIQEELEDWARLGVEGHLKARHPWLPYHEFVTEGLARVVGAKSTEVVAMNSLTTNLHLLMVSFYRPTRERYKILVEAGAFPSDQYAVASQARFHARYVGFDPSTAILELKPRDGEKTIRPQDVIETLDREGSSIALVLLGGVNYLTGQAFDMAEITRVAHKRGCWVGYDLAHAAGNLKLELHEWNVDFAAWCNYKYLNSGPGAIAGAFVHERHTSSPAHKDMPRFEGWWGHDKASRFEMGPNFEPIPTAEAWQLSNPPIFQLAVLRASLELFDQATMTALRKKSEALTAYLEKLLETLPSGFCSITTPKDPKQRGCQLSLRFGGNPKELQKRLLEAGVICDFREPDIIRAAPTPLYNRFSDALGFARVLHSMAETGFRNQ